MKRNNPHETPNQIRKREELQKDLDEYYNGEGKKLLGIELTQTELAEKLHRTQSDISRILKGYEIDWCTGKIIEKTAKIDLAALTKGITIVKPSTFFINVSRVRRKKLKDALLKYFPSDETHYGIIHIIETENPSGLLIFSNDHNLQNNLSNSNYLKSLENSENENS